MSDSWPICPECQSDSLFEFDDTVRCLACGVEFQEEEDDNEEEGFVDPTYS